ncbi:MAG: Gfo/Idh/MocA family oxidoreductase [Steroidobacter sp.]
MSGNDIRVGLLGYGLSGACFHAPLIAATPGLRLTTVVTRDAARREQALREHPGVRILDAAEDLWRNAAEHDLIVIATPNRTHAPLALAALEAELPIVVDKPFARTVAEARQVIAAARARGLLVSAYHNRRWDSELLTLQRLMSEGVLGRVLRFESRLERWRPQLKGGWRESAAAEEAGGLLFDLGSHLIDQALHLFGRATHVYAELDSRRSGIEVDDDVFLALMHENGVRSHLWTSYLAAQHGPRMRVLGARAAFVKQHADMQEAVLRAGGRPEAEGWGEEPPEHWGVVTDGVDQRAVPSEKGAYQNYYVQIARALHERAPPPVDPEDAVTGLQIIEAARRSAAEHQVIRLPIKNNPGE